MVKRKLANEIRAIITKKLATP